MSAHIAVSVEGFGRIDQLAVKERPLLAVCCEVERRVIELTKLFLDQEYQYPATSEEVGHSIPPDQIALLIKSMSRDILNYCELVWLEGENTDAQIVRILFDRASEAHRVQINLTTHNA